MRKIFLLALTALMMVECYQSKAYHDDWISYSYVPVFDTDTQAIWDKALSDFYDAKQAWRDKYGCE